MKRRDVAKRWFGCRSGEIVEEFSGEAEGVTITEGVCFFVGISESENLMMSSIMSGRPLIVKASNDRRRCESRDDSP